MCDCNTNTDTQPCCDVHAHDIRYHYIIQNLIMWIRDTRLYASRYVQLARNIYQECFQHCFFFKINSNAQISPVNLSP